MFLIGLDRKEKFGKYQKRVYIFLRVLYTQFQFSTQDDLKLGASGESPRTL